MKKLEKKNNDNVVVLKIEVQHLKIIQRLVDMQLDADQHERLVGMSDKKLEDILATINHKLANQKKKVNK